MFTITVAPVSVQRKGEPVRFVALDSGDILVGCSSTYHELISGCDEDGKGHAILTAGRREEGRLVFVQGTPSMCEEVEKSLAAEALLMAVVNAAHNRFLNQAMGFERNST
ncbi:hypothetical protein A3C86_00150 [Candidatus Kaiserbacteria bacterium RIFCSPHIGHO2_02_FULL_49_16]|uniref:Uncharacterized protein n=1 Tax=Candidatus Kaiserbacteria bacterium RIFCSPHIGHO2_02_FULL_49_16 TaxID=1798490 RepID=A0A1F6DH62_9BACT|nr:MAG: hypothetical protein A3C86_00150 [Candidatus Kaiserbacteria bacterium RIFCSPHIGHO2_02_FULL_49_16]